MNQAMSAPPPDDRAHRCSSGQSESQTGSQQSLSHQHQHHHHHHHHHRKSPSLQENEQQQRQQQQQQQQQRREESQGVAEVTDDYQILLSPNFAAMTRITEHLFITGIGGMTKSNFRKNHIDFVVNITTEAPAWRSVEGMRVPLEDESSADISAYLDIAVDKINELIVRKNAHVLVHCIAGVSRSATIVLAYLMKYKRMDLRSAFALCYSLRPVIRPNNGFMRQLIKYELHLFGCNSAQMISLAFDGVLITVPDFFLEQYPNLLQLEVFRMRGQAIEQQRQQNEQQQSHNRRLANKSGPTDGT